MMNYDENAHCRVPLPPSVAASSFFLLLHCIALHDMTLLLTNSLASGSSHLFCHRSRYSTLCFFHHVFFFLGFMLAI
jgi:hypothetical protein